MSEKWTYKFFLNIVLPSILAIGLFIVSIFSVIIPSFEKNMMERKKEMIRELTNSTWSLLEEYNNEIEAGKLTPDEAREQVVIKIMKIRYGKENKDYFWIIDQKPVMIMHPYRTDLISANLSDYKDPNGKRLFVEATKLVADHGEGFIDYMWQWKDDSTRIVPKISYVKGFKPWGWIIGTGIYLEDVKAEIKTLKSSLVRISLIIILIISVILLFIIRQSKSIEDKRKETEDKLRLSRQKYKSLVEASTEGTIMILNGAIIFSNIKFSNLCGYDAGHLAHLSFDELFTARWRDVITCFDDPNKSVSLETQLTCKDNIRKEVITSISKIDYARDKGYIIVVKEIARQKQIEKESRQLSKELQASLLLMDQPLRNLKKKIVKCTIDTSIQDAVKLMIRKKINILFIQKDKDIIGVVNNSDLKKRVLAENRSMHDPVSLIMSSPVITISENALMYEAVLLFKGNNISHIAIKNQFGKIDGVIGCQQVSEIQQNSMSYLIKEIEVADDIVTLQKIYNRVPVLINALVESSDKTENITRIITSVSDAIANRVLVLAIEEQGTPPCEFAFMVMGSEGRMEQTLFTDQDNAIVFEDLGSEGLDNAYKYFYELGKQVSHNLNIIGYNLCKGEVMASNSKWVQPLSVWKEYFLTWINTGDPQDILDASIFFDFRSVYGSEEIINDLRMHVNVALENKSVFFYHLAQSVFKFKPPVNLFGNIVGNSTSDDKINVDIKKILMPIVGFIRIYALHNKLTETNSLERARQLFLKEVINPEIYKELVLAYNYLMQLRFRFQAKNIAQNKLPDNIVDVKGLTHIEVATLKKVFSEIGNLQIKLNADFKGVV